jgi:hypothetical protein
MTSKKNNFIFQDATFVFKSHLIWRTRKFRQAFRKLPVLPISNYSNPYNMKKTLKLLFVPVVALVIALSACTKDGIIATVTEAVDQALYSVQERGGVGKYGCYELVFPVTVQLPDSTTATVNSYEELKQVLGQYFTSNGTGGPSTGEGHQGNHGGHHGGGDHNDPGFFGDPGQPGHPFHVQFIFPISVLNQDGEIVTVENEQQLRDLREACAGTFGNHGPMGHGDHGLSCFRIVFPITVAFPDSTTAQATDQQNLRQLVHEWRQNNPGVHDRPEIVFPITVVMTADSTQVVLNSRDELHALKESCE